MSEVNELHLPLEVWEQIALQAEAATLFAFALTCRSFAALVRQPRFQEEAMKRLAHPYTMHDLNTVRSLRAKCLPNGWFHGPFDLEFHLSASPYNMPLGDWLSTFRCNYARNKREGPARFTNHTFTEYSYYSNDKLEGLYLRCHCSGQVSVLGFHKNGVREGMWSFWSEEGTLTGRGYYRKGKCEGAHLRWLNRALTVTHYEDGLKEGQQTEWFLGKLVSRCYYHQGRKEGEERTWPCIEGAGSEASTYFVKDLEEGERRTYYNNGALATVSEMKAGRHHGWSLSYYNNGELRSRSYFCDGDMTGETCSWNEQGVLVWQRFL